MINIGHSVGGCSDFSKEIETKGYAIFSKVKARIPGYYPNEFPEFNDIDIDDVKTDDLVTVRAFFKIKKRKIYQVDGGLIDMEIEAVEKNIIWANINTELPKAFPL